MAERPGPAGGEVPEGAAVFPEIPAELGVQPLLLAALHALVFLQGSSEAVVHPAAADEALGFIENYLRRLAGPDLRRAREDIQALAALAREEKWPRENVRFLHDLLPGLGVGRKTDGE